MVAHVVHRFGVGGLENGLVNLINRLPPERYRHAVVCLTDYSEFSRRIRRPDVDIIALNKEEGRYPTFFRPLWRIFRKLRPDIVHTRNLATLEAQIPAYFLRIPHRIHGEHGRDMFDLRGENRAYNLLRKAIRPLVHHYVAVSRDLERWLETAVGVPTGRITQIYNGVDTARFFPRQGSRPAVSKNGFIREDSVIIGTVGRMAAVKDQLTLVRAFLHLLDTVPEGRQYLRLIMVGEGPLRSQATALLDEAGAAAYAWLPGDRDDIPELLQSLDIFVLPSLAEGISNTLLEAMGCGLPVVATQVGGNLELVEEGVTGRMVPHSDPAAMADALREYIHDPTLRSHHGRAARQRVERHFSLEAMVAEYARVYEQVLTGRQPRNGRIAGGMDA